MKPISKMNGSIGMSINSSSPLTAITRDFCLQSLADVLSENIREKNEGTKKTRQITTTTTITTTATTTIPVKAKSKFTYLFLSKSNPKSLWLALAINK